MQRHALSSATLEDVLTALVDGLVAVSDSNDSGMLFKDNRKSLKKVRYITPFCRIQICQENFPVIATGR